MAAVARALLFAAIVCAALVMAVTAAADGEAAAIVVGQAKITTPHLSTLCATCAQRTPTCQGERTLVYPKLGRQARASSNTVETTDAKQLRI
uniref:Uncharacterized protein n=1 Tax=Oryza rufipogon TaxID=4529 RepID=A0A0E0QWA0_ORYRU